MRCMSCGHDNPPGLDHCEQCHTSFTQEDVPLAKIKSAMEHSLSEDKIGTLSLVEAISVPEETSLEAAIRTMCELKIGCLLICWNRIFEFC